MGIENQALIFSTNNLPGFDQMALDLNSLDQTISNPEIILTLRFYYWTGDWLSVGYHQKEIPSLSAKTPACITTMRLNAIRFIV